MKNVPQLLRYQFQCFLRFHRNMGLRILEFHSPAQMFTSLETVPVFTIRLTEMIVEKPYLFVFPDNTLENNDSFFEIETGFDRCPGIRVAKQG